MAEDRSNSESLKTTATPFTPRRPSFSSRLQMLPGAGAASTAAATRGSPNSTILDPALGYSVARRPRLDFARACTSLHHSTLAEQPSPESSPSSASNAFPTYTPRRQSDSPLVLHTNSVTPIGLSAIGDSSAPSCDDSSSTSDDEELDLDLTNAETPTILSSTSSSGFRQADFPSVPASRPALQAASMMSLMRRQKAKLRSSARTSRRNSSSCSGSSGKSMASPSPTTPPVVGVGNSYFGRLSGGGGGDIAASRRRDSLSQALNDSFVLDSGSNGNSDENDKGASAVDPIRRVVTRRGNLLPKTKNFQRVKAELLEETSLPDIEIKREAEITKQLREDEASVASTKILSPLPPLDLQSTSSETAVLDEDAMSETTITPPIGPTEKPKDSNSLSSSALSFIQQAQLHGFFSFEPSESIGASPPRFSPSLRKASDGDIIMNSDSTVSSPVSAEIRRSKRRRTQDERFEPPSSFKRRAVSPGVCQSPILGGSPSSSSSVPGPAGSGGGGTKRMKYQGMNDTNEGLMKMTL